MIAFAIVFRKIQKRNGQVVVFNRLTQKSTLLFLFIFIGVGFFIFNITNAQGITEGTGTHFEINNSAYLNIKLQSSQALKLSLESVPEMITIIIEPTSTVASSQITISGFASSTTYYKYEDDYHNLTEFITDETGSYTYFQDISNPHIIFVQPRKSTKFISDNPTGGQCYLIGVWDNSLKTCALTQDVYESIQIDSNNITLDGNGHNINGTITGYGIYSFGKSGIKIKNLTITNFTQGVAFFYTSNGLIENNNISSNRSVGINIRSSNYNKIIKNTISNNYVGLWLGWYYYPDLSIGNEIYNNNFINNTSMMDLVAGPSANTIYFYPLPIGGNYWSRFDAPIEGCNDLNNDNICDSSYGPDNLPWTKLDGWITQPPAISNINQYKSDATNAISEGGVTPEDSVVFGAILNSSSTNQLQLQIELRQISESFTNQPTATSTFISPGSATTITSSNLVDGQYHWQARVVDSQGNASGWREFGTVGNVDFIVNLPLSYKAAHLAKQLVDTPYYTLGAKGWDYNNNLFTDPTTIESGYSYWNQAARSYSTARGVDCSGLVMWAYNRSFDPMESRFNNFVKAEGADGQFNKNTATTTESELKPGDVMFFDWGKWHEDTQSWDGIKDGYIDHVVMYVGESGGFDVISASSRREGIVARSKNTLENIAGFVAFKQVISALPPAVLVAAHSPVDLIVTDPDGFMISPTTTVPSEEEYLREIPDILYYSEMERGADGNPIDQVYSYSAKTGDYMIRVVPASNASPTSTYSLDFSVGSTTIILASNTPINQIPRQGYGVSVSASGTVNYFIPVPINIKPGSYPNSVNLGSNGVVPVAIFGSATLDVHQIDPTTVKLANASVKLKGNGQPQTTFSDINGDGFTDLIVNVLTDALRLTSTDINAVLVGRLTNGTIIKGSDSVRIVP